MKYKILLFLCILTAMATKLNAQMKIADSENLTINSNAILDLESDSLGLLLPRMPINDLNSPNPLINPVTPGMVVYSSGGSVTDGAYLWNGSKWLSLSGSGPASPKTNYVLVESLSDLPSPSGGVISLADNYTYEINGLVDIGANSIQMGNLVTIFGDNKITDILRYTGGGHMIDAADKTFNIRNITLSAPNSIAKVLSVSGSSNSIQLNDNIFNDCNELGTFNGGDILIVDNNLIDNCSRGFELIGTFNQFLFLNNIARNNSDILISLPAGNFDNIMVQGNYFDVGQGLTALNISTGTTVSEGFVANNFFLGNGAYLSGISYSDLHWTFDGNTGIKDSKAFAYMRFWKNSTVTNIDSKYPAYYKAQGSNYSSSGVRFTSTGNNRLIYNGLKTVDLKFNLDGNVESSISTENIRVAVYKNGNTNVCEVEARTSGSNQPYSVGLNGHVSLSTGDYLEVWVANSSSTANITLSDLQFTVEE